VGSIAQIEDRMYIIKSGAPDIKYSSHIWKETVHIRKFVDVNLCEGERMHQMCEGFDSLWCMLLHEEWGNVGNQEFSKSDVKSEVNSLKH
jgi:hypothetical protein